MTMLEKIAMALCNFEGFSWNEQSPMSRERYLAVARTVVKAMREPTDQMSAKMLQARGHLDLGHLNPRLSDEEAQAVGIGDHLAGNPAKWCKPEWRIAIDTILNEK